MSDLEIEDFSENLVKISKFFVGGRMDIKLSIKDDVFSFKAESYEFSNGFLKMTNARSSSDGYKTTIDTFYVQASRISLIEVYNENSDS